MSWTASIRHGVREAPAGLALVQDLLNCRSTRSSGPGFLTLLRRPALCRNADCRLAFDSSDNNTTVWHDPSTCGDTADLWTSIPGP
jgi:hypothetical protein